MEIGIFDCFVGFRGSRLFSLSVVEVLYRDVVSVLRVYPSLILRQNPDPAIE